jgi:hypothetical protein
MGDAVPFMHGTRPPWNRGPYSLLRRPPAVLPWRTIPSDPCRTQVCRSSGQEKRNENTSLFIVTHTQSWGLWNDTPPILTASWFSRDRKVAFSPSSTETLSFMAVKARSESRNVPCPRRLGRRQVPRRRYFQGDNVARQLSATSQHGCSHGIPMALICGPIAPWAIFT